MNKEWSELNKAMQTKIRKNDTYEAGIDTLFELRNRLMKILTVFYSELNREEFNAIPFLNADGYHSKTIAYSIWHIFRIEDIVAHILINEDEQVFYTGNYQERINSPIITTVSYTHLDVYKRQALPFLLGAKRKRPPPLCKRCMPLYKNQNRQGRA